MSKARRFLAVLCTVTMLFGNVAPTGNPVFASGASQDNVVLDDAVLLEANIEEGSAEQAAEESTAPAEQPEAVKEVPAADDQPAETVQGIESAASAAGEVTVLQEAPVEVIPAEEQAGASAPAVVPEAAGEVEVLLAAEQPSQEAQPASAEETLPAAEPAATAEEAFVEAELAASVIVEISPDGEADRTVLQDRNAVVAVQVPAGTNFGLFATAPSRFRLAIRTGDTNLETTDAMLPEGKSFFTYGILLEAGEYLISLESGSEVEVCVLKENDYNALVNPPAPVQQKPADASENQEVAVPEEKGEAEAVPSNNNVNTTTETIPEEKESAETAQDASRPEDGEAAAVAILTTEQEEETAEIIPEEVEKVVITEEARATEQEQAVETIPEDAEKAATTDEAQAIEQEETPEVIPTETEIEVNAEKPLENELEAQEKQAEEAVKEETTEETKEEKQEENEAEPIEEAAEAESEKKETAEVEEESSEEAAETAEEPEEAQEEEPALFEGTLTKQGYDFTVTAVITKDAGFPADVTLRVREVFPGTAEYKRYLGLTDEELSKDWNEVGDFARILDISFWSGDVEVQPQAYIDVQVTFHEAISVDEESDLKTFHFGANGTEEMSSQTSSEGAARHDDSAVDSVSFSTDSFSVYVFVKSGVTKTKTISANGKTYEISVTYSKDAKIPDTAEVKVSEITESNPDYEYYRMQAAAALKSDDVILPGLYDISLYDGQSKIEPADSVQVSIRLADAAAVNSEEELHIVHFPDGIEAAKSAEVVTQQIPASPEATEDVPQENKSQAQVVYTEVIQPTVEGQTVTFDAQSFSVYALAYTVDFHYEGTDYSIEGESQILLSDLIKALNVTDAEGHLINVKDVALVTFTNDHLVSIQHVTGLISYNGVENVNVGDEDYLLTSLEPFTTDEELVIKLTNGEEIVVGVTDAQVDNRVTAEVYFLNTDGTRTNNAETESGNTLNARINLSNSSANSSEDAYVKISLAGLGEYVKLNETFTPNAWDSITFRDMTTGTQYSIGVYYNTTDNSITYRVPPGATGIAALSFTAPNGITPDETTLTLTPTLVNSSFNPITPEANDAIGEPASGKWVSDFDWDPIQKYVNNSKENTVVVTDNNGTPQIDAWLHYDYNANSKNRDATGVRWTEQAIIEDSLTLPEHMSFAGSYVCNTNDGRIYINGASAPNNILFGLTLKDNMQCTNLTISGNTISYRIVVTNPNKDNTTNELTGEMDNISFITELNAGGITLDSGYITSRYYGEEIINSVNITEKPNKGTDDSTSQDQVKTKTKEDEGYSITKESAQDGQYVEANSTIDYTIKVANTGTATIAAAESIVYDTLPGAVYLTESEISRLQNQYGDKITIEGNNITFRTGELLPQGVSELIIHATVKDSKALEQAGYTNESAITNTASYRGLSDYVASKLHAGSITSEKASNLASGTALADGQSVNFTLTAKNETAYAYTGEVTLLDDLPKYLTVTIYDASGADITANTYANPGTYNTGCYVRDSANNLVPATVVINNDGTSRIIVNKLDGLAANSTYSIVLSAKYNAEKAEGTVNDNGNIKYTNTVHVNNTQSYTDIEVKVGKIDVDKYVSGASISGSAASQPFADGTEVTYTIHVTNDTNNPYKYDIVVTDTLPRGLVPMGLTVDSTVYDSWQDFVNAFGWEVKDATILDGNGNAQSVKVGQAHNGLKLVWTIPNSEGNLITSRDITYKAVVKTDELANQTTGLQDVVNTVTVAGREDKEVIVVEVKGVDISKKIIGPNGTLLDTIEIGPGSVVTYELTIDNPEHLNTTVTGITDYLPHGGWQSTFPLSYWQFGTTLLVDETTTGKNGFFTNAVAYTNNDSNYGRKYWFDNSNNLRFGDINVTSDQTKLVQRITLVYPDDPAVLHTMFVDTVWGRQQKNKYSISGMTPVEVDHTEVTNKKFYVQKSVTGLAGKDTNNNPVQLSSKDLFMVGDVTDVYYTVMVVNNGTGSLHINSLSDILPAELEFKAIAANDYNAGSHVYNVTQQITTTNQNNNPNYVCPTGYSGLDGVNVTASSPSGNTVLFTLNDGAGVDLPEKMILAFDVQCSLKTGITLINGQPIQNTIQADLDSDAALSKMAINTQNTKDNSVQNNGSCLVVSNDGTHQIAESSVTIHPSNVAVPGILKKAIAYKSQNDSDWTALNDNTTNINSQSAVKWKITLYNDGAVPLNGGYTLSDSIYEHHSFGSVESFTINGSSKDLSDTPFTGMTTEKEGHYNKYTFTFPAGENYSIPAGGSAELVLITSFTSGQYQGQLDNEAIFYPVQEWDANRVIRGHLEKNESGTEYIGVSSMDYVNMLGDGATMSYKVVTEKNDETNHAYGYDVATGRNYITVDDTNQVVTYTNHVQNLTNATFKEFVMIDRMPEIGDTGVVNAHDQRGSEYSIGFADTLNLSLTFRNSDGSRSISLTDEDYSLQFSGNTTFTTEDWDGTSIWNASSSNAKSFRLMLNPESLTSKINSLEGSTLTEAVFPSMWVLEVSYDGKLSTDATAGQYAWNSFGYHYKTAADVNMSAEPTKAGVRLKPLPVLKKQVLDNQGIDQGIDTSVQFTFKFYNGSHTLEEIASLTPIWETTLYQGQAVQLFAQKTVGGVTTGYFTEGQFYTVVEEPVAGYDLVGYEKNGLKQTTAGYCVFQYSNELNTTIVCQNQISGFTPEAEKVLYAIAPRTLRNAEFSFELLPLSNVDLQNLSKIEEIGTRLQQASNDASGHVQFDTIELNASGTYYFLMREVSGSDSTVVYDDSMYLVEVQANQVVDRIVAVGTYYKVTDSDENDPVKAVQALDANAVPEFKNTEATQIQVQKIWSGDTTSGRSTMVLYRTIGEDAAVPTNTYNVTINATLDNPPADSGNIVVSYSGNNGHTGSITLSNNLGWTGRTVTLNRGETYTFTYTADGTKVTGVSPETTTGVTDPTTISLSATAVATQNYTITFSVPSSMTTYNDGTITVVPSTGSNLVFTKYNWGDKTVSVSEESAFSYTVSVDGKFITEVTPASGSYSSVRENKAITLSPTPTPKTRTVQASVNWGENSDKVPTGTEITVTFTGSDESTGSAILNSANGWSDSVNLNNLDSEGNVVSYTVSYSPNKVTATDGLFTLTGTESLSGDAYSISTSYVDTVTVYFDKNGYSDATFGNVYTSDWGTNLGTPAYDNASGKYKMSGLVKDAQYYGWVGEAKYTVSGADEVSGNNVKFTATEGKTIAVTGTVASTMTLVVKCPTEGKYANIGDLFTTNSSGSQWVSDVQKDWRGNKYWGIWSYSFSDLPIVDSNGDTIYYGLWLNGTHAIETNCSDALLGTMWSYNRFIYFPAQSGTIIISAVNSDSESLSYNSGLTAQVIIPQKHSFRLIASNGTSDTPLSAGTTFEDRSIVDSGTAFSAIHFKDLPAGAEIATDIVGIANAEKVITNNGTYTWANLPAVDDEGNRIYYYVVEKEAQAHADEVSVSYAYEYNIANDPTSGIKKVTITNTTVKRTGNLAVTKHISGGTKTSFNFTVTLGQSINGTYGGMTFHNGVATFTLTDGQTVSTTGLPAGVSYTVVETEANQGGYTTTSTGATGTIPAGGTAQAEFTNTYSSSGSVSFKAKKTLSGGTLTENQFSFELIETDSSWQNGTTRQTKAIETYGNSTSDVTFSAITLSGTSTRYFIIKESIPTGNEADGTIIYDEHEQKITVSVTDNGSGSLVPTKTYDPAFSESGYDASFTNMKKGSLKITKAVTVNGADDTSNVTDGTYSFSVAGVTGTATAGICHTISITFASGRATSYQIDSGEAQAVTGTDNTWSVVLTNLIPGNYTITETGTLPTGMTLASVTGGNSDGNVTTRTITATVTAGDTTPTGTAAQVVFTNNKTVTGSLVVTKHVQLNGVDATVTGAKTFVVGLYKWNATANNNVGAWEAVQHEVDGSQVNWTETITVAADSATGSVTFAPLAVGEKYRVYELDGNSVIEQNALFQEYTVTYGDENGVVITVSDASKSTTVTNNKETTTINATKTWGDGSATPPAGTEITWTITATTDNGVNDVTSTALPSGETAAHTVSTSPWSTAWPNLPKVVNGKTVTYSVAETAATYGRHTYTAGEIDAATVDSATLPGTFAFTNTLPTIDIPVLKTWANATPKAGDYVKIGLFASDGTTSIKNPNENVDAGQTAQDYVLTINYDAEHNTWPTTTAQFENLPMYDNGGNAITYKVVETEVKLGNSTLNNPALIKTVYENTDGMVTSTENISTVTITNTVQTETYKVKKTWGNGQSAPEGAEIEITLSGMIPATKPETEPTSVDLNTLGVTKTTAKLNGGASGGDDTTTTPWEYEWTGLPKYDNDGKEITYSATETSYKIAETDYSDTLSPSADTTVEGYDLVLTNPIPTTRIAARKYWPVGQITLPEGTTVKLRINATVNDGNGGTDTPNGVSITPTEVTLDGIVDNAGEDDEHPNPVYETTSWQYEWTNLPQYDSNGKLITYAVEETEYKIGTEFTATVFPTAVKTIEGTTTVLTFTNELPTRDIVVEKAWSPVGWPEGIRSVTVGLYAVSGAETTPSAYPDASNQKIVTITAENSTSEELVAQRTFSNLPVYDANGNKIAYSVQEITVTPVNGESCSVTNGAVTVNGETWTVLNGDVNDVTGTATVTNTYSGISINVTKQWTKDDRPKTTAESISFTLHQVLTANGQEPVDTVYAAYGSNGEGTVRYISTTGWELVSIPNLPMMVTRTVTGTDGQDATDVTYNASYYVVETDVAADAGYMLTTAYNNGTGDAAADATSKAVSTNGATITIINTETAGVELPATGGPGTAIYTVAGLMLITLAGVLMINRRKKYNR